MKTITVKDETHARLRKSGYSGESMDTIITSLLDFWVDYYHEEPDAQVRKNWEGKGE